MSGLSYFNCANNLIEILYFYFFRYLKEKNYLASIVRHYAFWSSKVLEGKAKIARMNGKGKVPRVRTLSGAEDNILWDSGQLGCSFSRSLIQTVWWNNCLYFSISGRKEHRSLRIEHFCLETDENGRR